MVSVSCNPMHSFGRLCPCSYGVRKVQGELLWIFNQWRLARFIFTFRNTVESDFWLFLCVLRRVIGMHYKSWSKILIKIFSCSLPNRSETRTIFLILILFEVPLRVFFFLHLLHSESSVNPAITAIPKGHIYCFPHQNAILNINHRFDRIQVREYEVDLAFISRAM